jgi:hypothetical protein
MAFIKEQKTIYKTVLSDLQGAWQNLRAAAEEKHPFPESDRLIFQIDEAMSWENVRDLSNMKKMLLVIHNLAQQAKAPVEVLEGIEMVRIELDEVFEALAEGKIT